MDRNSSGDIWQNCSDVGHIFCNLTANISGKYFHLMIEDILLDILGPKKSPFCLPVSIIYLLIFTTGVAGNLLTCTVILKHKKMQTPTNLYLFSLAISDLLVLLLGMPLEIYDLWQNYPFPFGESVCYFKTLLFETVCFASVLNVMALSVERYVAVVHPLKTRYAVTNKHACRVIGTVWVASLACAVPNTSLHGIYYLYLPERVAESAICSLLKPRWIYNLIIQVTTVLFYVVPMTVISVLHVIICCRLSPKRRQPLGTGHKNCSSDSDWKIHLENSRKRQVTRMLSVVVLVFAICWAPFHVDRLLWSFVTQWTDLMHSVFQYVHILSGVLFYLSSAINPIIYNMLSTRFREHFYQLVCMHSRGHSPPVSKVLKSSSARTTCTQTGDVRIKPLTSKD